MREILFRGKRIDNKEWIYGGLILTQHRAFIVDRENKESLRGFTTHHADMYDWRSTEVVPPTVGQYTGLKDKNGVKIFEGDIVTFEDAVADYEGYHDDVFLNRGEVTYTERGMCLYFTNRQVVVMDDLFYKGTADCEVVGNIYDNPEMAGEEDTL